MITRTALPGDARLWHGAGVPLTLPDAWRAPLAGVAAGPAFSALSRFVDEERAAHVVYPPAPQVFAALERVPPREVRAVIVGQDPYHAPGQAHGLAFSVPAGVPAPPSLRNLLAELASDLGRPRARVDLEGWARQGVLLLNTVLTVRDGAPGSHRRRGWEAITDAALEVVAAGRPVPVVLWGADAQKKRRLFEGRGARVICGVHPSPLSAHRGFFGSRPFSAVDRALDELGLAPLDWWA